MRAPLGVAVIGGVITSTFLTLLVIPTFYEIMDSTRAWLAHRLGFRQKQRTAEFPVPGRVQPQAGIEPGVSPAHRERSEG